MGETNEQQRRFKEWPISELHGGGRFHPNQFKTALTIMKCRLCLDIPTSDKVIEYLVGKNSSIYVIIASFLNPRYLFCVFFLENCSLPWMISSTVTQTNQNWTNPRVKVSGKLGKVAARQCCNRK
jgi:hypothetical protein